MVSYRKSSSNCTCSCVNFTKVCPICSSRSSITIYNWNSVSKYINFRIYGCTSYVKVVSSFVWIITNYIYLYSNIWTNGSRIVSNYKITWCARSDSCTWKCSDVELASVCTSYSCITDGKVCRTSVLNGKGSRSCNTKISFSKFCIISSAVSVTTINNVISVWNDIDFRCSWGTVCSYIKGVSTFITIIVIDGYSCSFYSNRCWGESYC